MIGLFNLFNNSCIYWIPVIVCKLGYSSKYILDGTGEDAAKLFRRPVHDLWKFFPTTRISRRNSSKPKQKSSACMLYLPPLARTWRSSMSDKSFEWQNQLQEILHSPDSPDSPAKVAHLRHALATRLRIMTPVDNDERVAIKRALSVLRASKPIR
jgi:hypothetical protein